MQSSFIEWKELYYCHFLHTRLIVYNFLTWEIYAPFKNYLRTAQHDWQTDNDSKFGSCGKVCSWTNFTSSLRSSGIWPLLQLVFSDSDFAPSVVTDKHMNLEDQQNNDELKKTAESSNSPTLTATEQEALHKSLCWGEKDAPVVLFFQTPTTSAWLRMKILWPCFPTV